MGCQANAEVWAFDRWLHIGREGVRKGRAWLRGAGRLSCLSPSIGSKHPTALPFSDRFSAPPHGRVFSATKGCKDTSIARSRMAATLTGFSHPQQRRAPHPHPVRSATPPPIGSPVTKGGTSQCTRLPLVRPSTDGGHRHASRATDPSARRLTRIAGVTQLVRYR